ncbi:MAG: hypothetical protein JOZ18_03950, partial [Chloroflexi bacterium]|nr:hypothetical protein [Chloroflexota bacterium]
MRLPPLTTNEIEVLPDSVQPLWGVYVAEIASGRIHIWQQGLDNAERAALLAHVDEALAHPTTDISTLGIRREIALHLAAQPVLA